MKIGVAISFIALTSAAMAQITNGNFDNGLTGWTITNTSNGTTVVQDTQMIDMDEAGPLGLSNAGRFACGNAVAPNQGQQGIEVIQSVNLVSGTTYTFEMDWKAYRENTTTANTEGGQFNLIVNGTSIAFGAAGSTSQAIPKFGHLSGTYTATSTGAHTIGVRITRQFTVPLLTGVPTLYQAIDNFTMAGGGGPTLIHPNAFFILQGQLFGGNVASLGASDDNKLFILNDESDSTSEIVLEGNGAPLGSTGTVTIETSATRTDLTEFVDSFSYGANEFLPLMSRSTTLLDTTATGNVFASNVSGTGQVSLRIRYIPQADLEAADGWSEAIDLVEWSLQ